MGKKHFMTIAAALFLGAGLLSAQRPGEQVKRDEVPMPTVHQDTLMKHVMELSSETYRGRLAGTERGALCAACAAALRPGAD